MEHPLDGSAWQRAKDDTKSAFLTISFWVAEMLYSITCTIAMFFTIPSTASDFIRTVLPMVTFAGGMLAMLGGLFLLSLVLAPYKQRNEARKRVRALEQERIPRFAVKPYGDRRQRDWQHKHLMYAELQVTNTSPGLTLNDVELRIVSCLYVQGKQDEPNNYVLVDLHDWNSTSIYWSERDAPPSQLRLSISPGATKTALVAFQDNSNGLQSIFNAPTPAIIVGGAKIEIEISSPDSALWKGEFYIQCHPNYLGGAKATFEFVEWEIWLANHGLANSQIMEIR